MIAEFIGTWTEKISVISKSENLPKYFQDCAAQQAFANELRKP